MTQHKSSTYINAFITDRNWRYCHLLWGVIVKVFYVLLYWTLLGTHSLSPLLLHKHMLITNLTIQRTPIYKELSPGPYHCFCSVIRLDIVNLLVTHC